MLFKKILLLICMPAEVTYFVYNMGVRSLQEGGGGGGGVEICYVLSVIPF